MKRNVTKLMAALALLLALWIPLTGWGQTKITNPSGIQDGKTYYIGATLSNNTDYYLKLANLNNGTNYGTPVTNIEQATTFTFHANGTNWTIELSNGKFLSTLPTDNGKLTVAETSAVYTATSQSNKIRLSNNNRSIQRNNNAGTERFGSYANSQTDVWLIEVVTGYTITAQSNNASYGSVSLSGTTITATPNDGYRVIAGNGGYTITAGTATVTNNGDNTFSVNPESDCTVQINFEAIPPHTATFSVNGETTSSQVIEGAAITFPADPADIGHMTFMGWTDAAIVGITDTPPTYVTSATMGSSDVTFYAVFANVIPGTETTVTDVLTRATTGVTDTNYSSWSGKTSNSNAVYAGNSAGGNDAIQLRSNNNNSGVVTTASGGKAKKVTISWNSNTSNGRVLDIYGKSSAYSAASDLYNSNNQGTKLGNVTYGTSTELTITGDYDYIGMRSNSGAMYITSISIEWESVSPDTYSNYCTTVGAIITVNPDAIELAADELDDTTDITFINLEITEPWEDCHVTFYDATGTTVVAQPDWVIEALVAEDNDAYLVSCSVYANEGPARTAYFKVYAYDENDNAVYSNLVTLSQAGYVMPSSVETWELTTLSELTADDVFVIVCYDEVLETSYAMANNNGTSAPSAVVVTVENDALTTAPAANLKWNVESTENGYIFYPNGSSDTWLYCTNSNDGVRVGTGNAKHFTIDGVSGYLTTTETTQLRYLGVYTDAPDWRCYTSINANIVNQTFAFYKKVAAPTDTNTKTIQPYNSTYDHYYLIASPVMAVEPSVANGFLTNNYDLYRFDQSHEDEEWLNYEVTPFYLLSGKGYLYANSGNNGNATTITFTGVPYNGNGEVTLSKVPDVKFSGWNLIGNPRNATAILKDANNQDQAYYTINQTNNEVAPGMLGADISAMEGVFVVAENDGDVVTFVLTGGGGAIGILPVSPEEPAKKGGINLNISKPQGLVIDRAIVRFDNGGQLPKFQLNPNNTKIYFTEDNKDFAVVRSANEGDMPVNFRAAENGTYSLSVEVSAAEMAYLHLIDNKTGVDVDLLANPSYTFEANANDYESRFRLVFNATGVEENNTNETFAFFNGSEWVINTTGNATLQVVDMMGRVLSSEQINGNTAVNLNQAAGIYVLRLVNGENVMVQKVVVR